MKSSGAGNGKQLQYSSLKNPMNSMERQKDMTPEDESPGQGVSKCYWGRVEAVTHSYSKNEVAGLKQTGRSVVDVSGGESQV